MGRAREAPALAELSRICLGLPEAERRDEGRHASFRVRGRVFAWYLVDHHGDGMISLNVKAAPGDNAALVRLDPARYHLPAYLAAKGWIGLRLDTGTIDWDEVAALVTDSYRLVAPGRLAAAVAAQRES